MSNELKDILSNSNKDIDNQQLMDYLSSHLSPPQQHAVESAMNDDAFMNDAVEGLQQMKDGQNIAVYVEQLNQELNRQVAKNKKRKDKRRFKDSPSTYIIIAALLLLLLISFVMVKKYFDAKKQRETKQTTEVAPIPLLPPRHYPTFTFSVIRN